MAYAVKADVQKRLSDTKLTQLTDFAATGAMDDAKITDALDIATATIDSYVSGRFVLPLAATKQVVDLCMDIAIFKLYQGRQLGGTSRGFDADAASDAYDRAIKFLEKVRDGEASLDGATTKQSVEASHAAPDREAEPRVFEDEHLKGF